MKCAATVLLWAIGVPLVMATFALIVVGWVLAWKLIGDHYSWPNEWILAALFGSALMLLGACAGIKQCMSERD